METRWYSFIFKDQETADRWIPILEKQRAKYFGKKITQTVSSLPLIDFDKLYKANKSTGANLIAVGHDDDSIVSGGNIEEVQKTLFQNSDGNLNFIAQCKCGQMRGNYHIGQICPHCKTKVDTPFSKDINIVAWLEIPESLPPFLHPTAYRILNRWIGVAKHKVRILDAIMNTNTDLPFPYNDGKLGQGMWYFYNNFKDIINYIASTRKGQRSKDNEIIFEFLKENGQPTDAEHPYGLLFTRHIPILNQSLHVITHSGSTKYNDKSSEYVVKTCIELGQVIYNQRHQPQAKRNYIDQQVFTTFKAWAEYTSSIIDDKLIHKSGFIRKNVLGTRLNWSGRGVIVPIVNTHWPDEIELPWRMVVGLFKLEILNKLKNNFGFDINTANRYWEQAKTGLADDMPEGRQKDKVLECINYVKACIDQLLAECPFKGFPIIMGRNPTLRHGETTSPHTREIWYCKCA